MGVVGLGRSGAAAVEFLVADGYEVVAWDGQPDIGSDLTRLPKVELNHDPDPAEILSRCQGVLLSPGVPRRHPALQRVLSNNIPVINDVQWLFNHSQSQTNPADFIAITGTNGKSTVTTLVGMMLVESGFNCKTGGNLGQAALSLWEDQAEKYVLELSSFQLESLPQFHPKTAALLNISPDHLDRYDGMADYMATKLNIFARQTVGDHAVVNFDDAALMAEFQKMPNAGDMTLIPFSTRQPVKGGMYIADGCLIDHRRDTPELLLECEKLKIAGIHNQANALAAAAIAYASGAAKSAIVKVLSTFPGLPHRMEWVRELGGVVYYNDSKGTNVGAVEQSLASFPDGLVLIAGGRDKNSDFSQLNKLVSKHVSNMILIGEAATAMAALFADHCKVTHADTLQQAVGLARQLAQPGDTVLFSPACASFDMFKNFEERGDIFRKTVNEL